MHQSTCDCAVNIKSLHFTIDDWLESFGIVIEMMIFRIEQPKCTLENKINDLYRKCAQDKQTNHHFTRN